MAATLRNEGDYPLQLGPNSAIRWIAVSADGQGRVSRSFKFWVHGREAYLSQRSLPDLKVSIHAEEGHAAFKDHETSRAWLGEDSSSRYLSQWVPPAEFHPGWREIFEVVHPYRELTEFAELGLEKVELEYLPVPPGEAVHVIVFRNRDVGIRTKVTIPNCIHLAVMRAGDWQYNLVAQRRPWGLLEQEMARQSRAAGPGARPNSLVPPGSVDSRSPGLRLSKFVTDNRGGRWWLELAGTEPAEEAEPQPPT